MTTTTTHPWDSFCAEVVENGHVLPHDPIHDDAALIDFGSWFMGCDIREAARAHEEARQMSHTCTSLDESGADDCEACEEWQYADELHEVEMEEKAKLHDELDRIGRADWLDAHNYRRITRHAVNVGL